MSSDPFPARQPDPASRGEPLVPLLRIEQALGDPDALATWYSAISNALSIELPHDLLGLWLYPAHGGVVLIGPEALAQDDLAVPVPAPQVEPSRWRCSRISCGTQATPRSHACRFARVAGTWDCCWRPISERTATARMSGSCWSG